MPTNIEPSKLYELSKHSEHWDQWSKWIPNTFPGFSVVETPNVEPGVLTRSMSLGRATLHSLIHSGQKLSFEASPNGESKELIGVLMQVAGHVVFESQATSYRCEPGSLMFNKHDHNFTAEALGLSHSFALIFPLDEILLKLPHLSDKSVTIVAPNDPSFALIKNIISDAFARESQLSNKLKRAISSAIVELLTALPTTANLPAQKEIHWRVNKALQSIAKGYMRDNFCADNIAFEQQVSRRYLDQLFKENLGTTISAQISERRLTVSAAGLCDPDRDNESITTIAFAAGFSDSAYFSRCFKARFGMSPMAWRKRTSKA